MKVPKHPFDEAVVAKTHPSLYLMHKYWARKPHNVVARYIEYYTERGDVVFDPFMGSGVTVIEALRLGRKAIGNDLNPIACFITRMTLLPVDLAALQAAYERIEAAVKDKINSYYEVICSNPKCNKKAITTQVVWKKDKFKAEKMFLLKVACPYCKRKEQRKPTDDDLQKYDAIRKEQIHFYN